MAKEDREEKSFRKYVTKGLEEQTKEMKSVTEKFAAWMDENQNATAEEVKKFAESQMAQAKSGVVKEQLGKRVAELEKLSGDLSGEELLEELQKMSQKFNDGMNLVNETMLKGHQLMSSGFSQLTNVFRESFGPLFDLWDSGVSILTGIYSTLAGALTFIKAIPVVLTSMKTWITDWLKRKEKREMREGEGGGPGLIGQILKGIGILGLGIVGAFAYMSEMAAKELIKAFGSIGRILRATFVKPVTKFLGKFRIGERIVNVFSRMGKWTSNLTKIGSSISKQFGKIGRGFKWLANFGSNMLALFTKWEKTGGPIVKYAAKIAKSMTKFGGFIGTFAGLITRKILLPIMAAYEVIKGFMSEDTIRDKILSASAGVLSIFTEIPEIIGNAILKLFGSDFRLDFGKEAIMDAVNVATEWAEKPIHAILDFFTKTLPDAFKSFTDWWDRQKEKVKNMLSWIPGIGDDKEPSSTTKRGTGTMGGLDIPSNRQGGIVQRSGLANVHAAEVIVPQDLSEKLQKVMRTDGTGRSETINNYEQEKIKLYKQMISSIEELKAIYREQTTAINRNQSNQQIELPRERSEEPPDEIESISLLIFNKNWGIA